jgi:rRNA maturation endonuclease Nob1
MVRESSIPLEASIEHAFGRKPVGYRIYCFACGRSIEVETVPRQLRRCETCGGTMIAETGDNGM